MANHACSSVNTRSSPGSSWGRTQQGTWGCSLSVPSVYASTASIGTYPLARPAIDELSKTASSRRITSPSCGSWNWHATRDGSYCCIDSSTCSSRSSTRWPWDDWLRWNDLIGDRRVSFTATSSSGQASVLALQTGNAQSAFGQWRSDGSSSGPSIYKIVDGVKTEDEMFDMLYSETNGQKWALRIFSWLFMWLGMQLITGPLTVAPDAIPFIGPMIGSLVAEALCMFNCAVATSWSLALGALMWVAVRPGLGVPVLLVGCGFCAGAAFMRSTRGKSTEPLMAPL